MLSKLTIYTYHYLYSEPYIGGKIMNESNSSGKGSGLAIVAVLVVVFLLLGSCGGESQYEKDSRSGFNKWTSGDYDSMTNGEKDAVEDFLNWQNKNQKKK